MSAYFSTTAPDFKALALPDKVSVVGYAAIIHRLGLPVPVPRQIAVVNTSRRKTRLGAHDILHFPKVYNPEGGTASTELEALYLHLVFALKYEGVNLLVFRMLCKHYSEEALCKLIHIEPTGQYSRRIWFLLEWVSGKLLPDVPDLSVSKKGYVDALDTKLQYSISGKKSERHRVLNNLPGTPDFCPLVTKTEALEKFRAAGLAQQTDQYLKGVREALLQRASAFLMLKDSKASFNIEGESPKSRRAALWGDVIGKAGSNPLSHEELQQLQRMVIENPKFVRLGYRTKGGFVGGHDRVTGTPVPEHISAKPEDLNRLMEGLLHTADQLIGSDADAVVAAAMVAFGFVFIHPFEDGNGRIHRYLVHHVLASMHFAKRGVVFPVSAAILKDINGYRKVLQAYSQPLLAFIDWEETPDHNVAVLNETADYYRFFDATPQAEFLYECVQQTIREIIPEEINYLQRYEAFKSFINQHFDMPDKMLNLLLRFLDQYDGQLSKRAREKEFQALSDQEVQLIASTYREIFTS